MLLFSFPVVSGDLLLGGINYTALWKIGSTEAYSPESRPRLGEVGGLSGPSGGKVQYEPLEGSVWGVSCSHGWIESQPRAWSSSNPEPQKPCQHWGLVHLSSTEPRISKDFLLLKKHLCVHVHACACVCTCVCVCVSVC